MKTRRIARSGDRTLIFQKVGESKKFARELRRVREGCPRPPIVTVQAFRNSVILPAMLLTSNRKGSS